MSIRTIGARTTVTRSAVTFALALAAVGGLATSSQSATTVSSQPAMTLNAQSGKETGTNVLLASTTTAKFYAGKVNVQFQLATSLTGNCQTNYTTPAANSVIAAPTVSIVNSKKLAITVPVLTGSTANTTQLWLICAYNSNSTTTSKLLAKAGYTSAGAPTLTALTADVQVPTYGGSTINVVGSGFAAGVTSATLAGKPLTDINVVDDTLFTATTPASAAGNAALTVNTVGGSATILSSAANKYTYVDSISVSPATGVSGTSVTLSVQGVGFNNVTWTPSTGTGAATDDANAHVYLVAASGYNPVASGSDKTAGQKNECTSIQVIDDNNLVCTLDLNKSSSATISTTLTGTPTATGLYQVSVVQNGTVGANSGTRAAQALSSGSVFTVAPF